ncbi:MAG: hypothetical protein Devi2KO_04250 [Devosia indica]
MKKRPSSWYAQAVIAGERNKQKMLRTGETFSGRPIWTEDEIAILIANYLTMSYADLTALLPQRSPGAIAHKVYSLGLKNGIPKWSDSDIIKLRRLYRRGTLDELRAAFPERSPGAIKAAALARGFKRPRRQYKRCGIAIADAVIQRAFELRYSMEDLDAICESGRYFRRRQWAGGFIANQGYLLKAIEEMGGHVKVVWDD